MSNFRVDDESGDRKYFTIIPNYVLNHSTAIDQALYLQMKRFAGENGSCFASGRTLRKKLGIGVKAYNKSIKYLLEHEWIYYKGGQMVETASGAQMVKAYGIKDLWKRNNEHYEQGVPKRIHLPKVFSKGRKVFSKDTQGVPQSAPNKNHEEDVNKDPGFFKLKEEMHKKYVPKKMS